jgi:tRNA-specific 2-thiouridylase
VAGAPYGVKSRYRQADAPATATISGTGLRIDFAAPQWAVTPGQSAVIYDGEVCLGGGVIAAALPSAVEAAALAASGA